MANMYLISGWIDPLHTIDKRRTPIEFYSTSKKSIQTHYRELCYKSVDPNLIRVFFLKGFRKIDITREFDFKELDELKNNKVKVAA